ncbi:YciI family protein [Actinospica robiniae]|jgi:uncharacterized protein YciI|uniref:YciI family protein n=1 Tax=Actinospica robiniae TaxID=304901 RepID=UPI00040F1BDB|nr:YciI family protein [Actinospica robiniae]
MQFMLAGYDGTDPDALNRRLAVREQHIALGDQLRDAGHMLYGGAILDDHGNMTASVLILDFPSRDELDAWLKVEPYVTGKVWEKIDIRPFRVGPSFIGLHL